MLVTTNLISILAVGMAVVALLAGIIIAKIRLGRATQTSEIERQRIKFLENDLNRCRQQIMDAPSAKGQTRAAADGEILTASLANSQDLIIIWDLKLKPLMISASVSHFLASSGLSRRSAMSAIHAGSVLTSSMVCSKNAGSSNRSAISSRASGFPSFAASLRCRTNVCSFARRVT